jgi:LytS/YehU family sensor histidine kinase
LLIGVAEEPKGTLRLWVENSVPAQGAAQAEGLGIGLENVAHRLQARWPGQSSFAATLSAQNRFRVQITLPLVWGPPWP